MANKLLNFQCALLITLQLTVTYFHDFEYHQDRINRYKIKGLP